MNKINTTTIITAVIILTLGLFILYIVVNLYINAKIIQDATNPCLACEEKGYACEKIFIINLEELKNIKINNESLIP